MNGLGQDYTDPNATTGTESYGTSDLTPVSTSPFQDFASGFASIVGTLTQASQAFNQSSAPPSYTVTAQQASKYMVPLLLAGAAALLLLRR